MRGMDVNRQRPNGPRLRCGRNAGGRKEVEPQRKRLAGEATQFFPSCERPAASSACWAARQSWLMNDSSNVDPAHSAPGHRDENDSLVEAPRFIADLNQRRVCMARAVTAGGVISRVAHPQPASSSTGRSGNRKDRDPVLLKKDVEVAVV